MNFLLRLKDSTLRLLTRVWFYFRPVPGWNLRVEQYAQGKQTWDVPGGDFDKTYPWPVQWLPHRLDPEVKQGFHFLLQKEGQCGCCGQTAMIAICCARCGLPLREQCAGMRHSMEAPSCRWCRSAVHRITR